jgi:hypothetical protein
LKLRLARQSPDNVRAYQDGKAAFCAELEKKAMQWAAEKEERHRIPKPFQS